MLLLWMARRSVLIWTNFKEIDSEAKEKANILNYVTTSDIIIFGVFGMCHCLHRRICENNPRFRLQSWLSVSAMQSRDIQKELAGLYWTWQRCWELVASTITPTHIIGWAQSIWPGIEHACPDFELPWKRSILHGNGFCDGILDSDICAGRP
jgi:hypothetical protein